jgi:pimeloyl-ACP methyl ester carboxylesterase
MSTTGSRWVGLPSFRAFSALLAKPPRNRDEMIERTLHTFKVIGSPGFPFDEARIREVAGRSYDRGHSTAGVIRQLHAVLASGDRTRALRELDLPATVIHGGSDPLIRPSGGRATAKAIPGARLRIIEGMGHDLPRDVWPQVVEEIAATAERARSAAPQPA